MVEIQVDKGSAFFAIFRGTPKGADFPDDN
jgi:hypothetical protein